MIPVFTGARANAILSKDTANVRSAYAEAVVEAMTTDEYGANGKLDVTVNATKSVLKLDDNTKVSKNQYGTILVTTTGATNGNDTGSRSTNLIKVDEDINLTLIVDGGRYLPGEDTLTTGSGS